MVELLKTFGLFERTLFVKVVQQVIHQETGCLAFGLKIVLNAMGIVILINLNQLVGEHFPHPLHNVSKKLLRK